MHVIVLTVSHNNTQTVVDINYLFSIFAYQVFRNIVLAPLSVMIMLSYHFISQSDCNILREVTKIEVFNKFLLWPLQDVMEITKIPYCTCEQ